VQQWLSADGWQLVPDYGYIIQFAHTFHLLGR